MWLRQCQPTWGANGGAVRRWSCDIVVLGGQVTARGRRPFLWTGGGTRSSIPKDGHGREKTAGRRRSSSGEEAAGGRCVYGQCWLHRESQLGGPCDVAPYHT